jgi:hypothetical protein
MADESTTADRDRTVVRSDGVHVRIFEGTEVPASLWELEDAPTEGTKAQKAPAKTKAQTAPESDK